MKLKEYFYMLGFKPRERRYGYRVKQFDIASFGIVEYAQWTHPSEKDKFIREDVVSYLKSFLENGDFCIDIGAHTGDTTIPMALAVGKNGFVLALEPNPYVFPVLNKNAILNKGLTDIFPLMIAATPKDGDIEFEYSDSGFCNGGLHENVSKWKHGHAFKLTVTGLNLSDLLRDKFSDKLPYLKYIKVDAEGYDLSILETIGDILEEYRPFIKAEIFKHTNKTYREKMYSFLSDRKYTIYLVENDNNSDEITCDYRTKIK
jgi:FkbM family methyltransferase